MTLTKIEHSHIEPWWNQVFGRRRGSPWAMRFSISQMRQAFLRCTSLQRRRTSHCPGGCLWKRSGPRREDGKFFELVVTYFDRSESVAIESTYLEHLRIENCGNSMDDWFHIWLVNSCAYKDGVERVRFPKLRIIFVTSDLSRPKSTVRLFCHHARLAGFI